MRLLPFALTIFASLSSPLLFATAAKPKSAISRSKSVSPRPKPIDPASRAVDAGYKGEAVANVFRLFSAAPKGEFESTAAYEQRISKLPFGTYALALHNAELSYDADYQVMHVRVPNSLAYSESPMRRWYEFEGELDPTGAYVGQNAYGAKARVTTAKSSRFQIIDRNSEMDSSESLEGQFAIASAEAKTLKPHLRVLLLAAIDAEAAKTMSQETQRTTATVSSPYEFTIEQYRMRAPITGFWVVDTKTGHVIYAVEFPPAL